MDDTPREFFPLHYWDEIMAILLDASLLEVTASKIAFEGSRLAEFSKEVTGVMVAASRKGNLSSAWIESGEDIGPFNRVELSFTPAAQGPKTVFTLDMAVPQVGIEQHLLGLPRSTRSLKANFMAGSLPMGHPMFFASRRQTIGTVEILKVTSPPFPVIETRDFLSAQELKDFLLDCARTASFERATQFAVLLRQSVAASKGVVKRFIVGYCSFLDEFSCVPERMRARIEGQIGEIGQTRDPELRLAFLRSLLDKLARNQARITPPAYFHKVRSLFIKETGTVLEEVVRQIRRQQAVINDNLKGYAGIEQDRIRMKDLKSELETRRRTGQDDELVRNLKNEMSRLQAKIWRTVRRYEMDLGILLMQEIYIGKLLTARDVELLCRERREMMAELSSLQEANRSLARADLDRLAKCAGLRKRSPGMARGGDEPAGFVLFKSIGRYEASASGETLGVLPSVKKRIGGERFSAEDLLDALMKSDIPKEEIEAFHGHVESITGGGQQHRLGRQIEAFLPVFRRGRGLDAVHDSFKRQLAILESVLEFASSQGRTHDGFARHMAYFRKLHLEPLFRFLDRRGHPAAQTLASKWQTLSAKLEAEGGEGFQAGEEWVLIQLFSHIVRQLENRKLFTANELTREVVSLMRVLKGYKESSAKGFMEMALRTYAVFMMGCSRAFGLASDGFGTLSENELREIRKARETLV